jgi:CMP-N-acetylneuraminic acid synthetase
VCFLNVVDEKNWEEIYRLAAQIYLNDKEKILKNEKAFSKHSWFENFLFSIKKQEITKDRYIEKFEII